MMRTIAMLALVALTACSGGGTSPSPIVARTPIAQSSASATAPSQMQTQATFVVHWPSTAQTTTTKRRNTISASTQSISVSVNQGTATIVNKPTSGNLSTSSISIAAPVGSDSFTFSAWDGVNATGNLLDQASTTQSIVANATNTVSLVLDGVCAALVPSIIPNPPYIQAQIAAVPLVSGSRTVLKSVRLVGPSPQTVQFTRVDPDGNTVLTSGDVSPISVVESGATPHVTIAPAASGVSNNTFTLTPTVAEPDGFSTTITAASPGCGSGTQTFPDSFQLSTSAAVLVADTNAGVLAYDQDGTYLGSLVSTKNIIGLAYNSRANYLVAIEPASSSGGIAFQTLSLTGTVLGSSSFTPQNESPADTVAASEKPGNLVYDPASGDFILALRANATTSGSLGAIEAYSISGSTATFVNENSSGTSDFEDINVIDPYCFAVLASGDVVDGDLGDEASSGTPVYFTDELTDSLEEAAEQTETVPTTSVSFDSTRDEILLLNSGGSGSYTPSIASESDPAYTAFTVPATPYNGGAYYASAYNPASDELYLFSASLATGLSGSTIAQGGSSISNLPAGAFPNLTSPNEAVVIP